MDSNNDEPKLMPAIVAEVKKHTNDEFVLKLLETQMINNIVFCWNKNNQTIVMSRTFGVLRKGKDRFLQEWNLTTEGGSCILW